MWSSRNLLSPAIDESTSPSPISRGFSRASIWDYSDKGAFMNPNKALWEKGDFTAIAAFMRESGETVVESLGVKPPLRALDIGCGDGTTAVPLARLGADVVGVDIARNLVKAGNKRAAEQGLRRLRFQEGDACNLQGIDDDAFELTLSVFGAMF